ncbi:T9SS type A sorting domain-containing protein [Hymenobacter chitinivorans]|uniref:Putative secreted protein (Por secretion system target) n=1 Tax=Hymenobacter chitinivorans DSM 11115 TaxID=1121954 RepID=A0A2M9B5T2_9BACT|nr:T9SS type A sorting domain-containing protein [Hymenobacter chitinivorans]PJJ53306.1 putative secreted protein (Por secretion system target) [Hymenobacter chitinivorans DSM 11115]
MKTFFTSSLLLLAGYLLAPAAQAQQLYTNGSFTTGTTSISGVVAPAGFTWSEVQNNTGVTTISNTNAGYTATKSSNYTLADNFVVPSGVSWTINNLAFFAYQSGYTGTTSPFTELYVRIWRGSPAVTGSTVVYGDLTTNRYAGAVSTNSYRIFNSLYPTASAPTTSRLIWKVRATLSPAPVLPAGTYWVEWTSATAGSLSHFYVPVTTVGARQTVGANALQYVPTSGTWTPTIDAGNPDAAPDVTVDFPFLINDATITATTAVATAGAGLRVGPVPTAQDVQLEFAQPRSASSLTLTDMQGRQVWTGIAPARSLAVTVPMTRLAAGIYTLSVSSAEGIERVRVVKY